MKYLFIFLGLTYSLSFSQSKEIDFKTKWLQNFEKAKHKAEAKEKSILMYFTGSDWCMPCIMLKEDFFESDRFKNYENSYVFLKVDIPRNRDLLTDQQMKQNYKLLKEYNKSKVFPLVAILSAKGKILDEVSGYNSLRDPKYYFELLDKFK